MTVVQPAGSGSLKPYVEKVTTKKDFKSCKVAHVWTGESRFRVAPHVQGNTVVKIPAKHSVPAGDLAPVAIADSGASCQIAQHSSYCKQQDTRAVTLRLAAGELKAVEHQKETYADHVSTPLRPLGRVIRK